MKEMDADESLKVMDEKQKPGCLNENEPEKKLKEHEGRLGQLNAKMLVIKRAVWQQRTFSTKITTQNH